ncbi:MAG: TIGR02757 family protein [Bacteroidales bacterium]
MRNEVGAALTLAAARRLKPALDRLYDQFDHPEAAADPIEIARRFEDPRDREVVAFCAAALAFGRVASVLQSIERLLDVLGPSPAAFVARFDPSRDRRLFDGLGHRWTRAADLAALVWILQQMIAARGSIEGAFLDGYDPASPDVGGALDAFSSAALATDLRPIYGRAIPACPGVRYFFPTPSAGSACKRLNLFLRWMVRRDGVDFGLWTRVSPSQLIVPLDTHVVRLSRCLGLTTYASPGWRMAAQITASLRRLDAGDPVKYDFALCHLGMMDACGFRRPYRDERCPLRGLCRPAPRTRRSSGRPSGPR